MTRIDQTFQSLERPALITYTVASDPDYDRSLDIMKALPAAGADIIELGMPFSDPSAEGPTIQRAHERALKASGSLKQTLEMVRAFRAENDTTPIVLMGYINPLLHYGYEAFANDAKTAGVDGLIIVDLPPEEEQELREYTDQTGLDFIRLITPSTDEERIKTISKTARGFLYYVSVSGVTGVKQADPKELEARIRTVQDLTQMPVAVGFGIRTAENVASMAAFSNAVVVGSAIVDTIDQNKDNASLTQAVSNFVKELSSGLS